MFEPAVLIVRFNAAAQRVGSQHRHAEQRQGQRAGERTDHRHRHGPEHAAFQPFEEKYGHVDGDDDADGENDGTRDFMGGGADNAIDVFIFCTRG